MRKSFRLFLCAILRRWWAVIVAIAAIIGIITLLIELTTAPWPWILIGAGILGVFIAAFLAFHRIQEELDKLKDTLPSITVTPDPEGSWARLSVHNYGGDAEFRAMARIIQEGMPIDLPWPLQWHGSLEETRRLFKNDHHILNIANWDWEYGPFDQEGRRHILFFTAKQSLGTTSGEEQFGEQFSEQFKLPPECNVVKLEVTITSSPELRLPFKERYIIKLTEDSITLESLRDQSTPMQ